MELIVPDQRDIIFLNFEPNIGNEIKKRRPALVLTGRSLNALNGLVTCVPMTSKKKHYSVEYEYIDECVQGVFLLDQIKSLSWRQREPEFITRISITEYQCIVRMLTLLMSLRT